MTTCTTNVQSTASRRAGTLSFWGRVWAILAVRKQRNCLSNLDTHMLEDIGLTRDAAEREAKRKLWDVPQHWLQ